MFDRWDLSIIYAGFDSPEFKADLASVDGYIEKLNLFAKAAPSMGHAEVIRQYITLESELSALVEKLYIYSSLTYSADTGSAPAQSTMGLLMGKLSAAAAAEAVLKGIIGKFDDLDCLIAANPDIGEYEYLLKKLRQDGRYLLSDAEEEIFARMSISGANAWEDLQSSLTSSLTAEYRGGEITLSEVRNLAYDADSDVRKDAYAAELACYKKAETSVAFALNSIKLQVINECKLRGYDSPLDKSLKDSRMKRQTLDALWGAIEEYLPKFWEYMRLKAKALGHEGGLPWYDMFAPMGGGSKKYSVEEARDCLLDIFGKVDGDIRDTIKDAFDNDWIDFFPRDGKVGGAFDCGVPAIGQSRVLTNFDGTFSSIVTLAHELGHAFHDRQVFPHRELNRGYPMPVAETASTFNEVLIVSRAIEEAETKEEKLALIEGQLSDANQIICDIYSRFLFESAVFENREQEFMGPERLCQLMHEAQLKAYGDGIAEDSLNPYMWLCKSHYYSGGFSFYNYPYAFGGLFARGLYAKYLEEGPSFFASYKRMLNATSVMDVEDCAALMGIDLTDRAFWRAGLQSLADEIDLFKSLLE